MAEEATTTTTDTTTTTTGGDWASSLPPDLQPLVAAKGWKTPADALTGYANLEKVVGAEKLPLPPKDATGNRDWSKWDGWNALGRPESPDKYDIADVQIPEGVQLDDKAKQGFLAEAHKHGLTNAQAKALLGWYGGYTAEAMKGVNDFATTQAAEAEAALKKEWGTAYDAKMDMANRAVKQFGGESLVKALEETGLGRHPEMVKAFAKVGEAIAEDGDLPGSKSSVALTPADALAQINAMHGDENMMKILRDKNHPEYAAIVAKRDRLYAAAYPDEAA